MDGRMNGWRHEKMGKCENENFLKMLTNFKLQENVETKFQF